MVIEWEERYFIDETVWVGVDQSQIMAPDYWSLSGCLYFMESRFWR